MGEPDTLQLPLEDDKAKVSTGEVMSLLRKRYPDPEWAFMEEVAPHTGGGTGYADGVAMNLWHSRGHAIHGFEVKTSRADWQKELRQPGKADPAMAYCDYWWLVAPRHVALDSEIPPTWGFIIARPSGLRVHRDAPKLTAKAPDRGFFASLVRRGFEAIDGRARALVSDELARIKRESDAAIEAGVASGMRYAKRELDELKAQLQTLEQETGISVTQYGTVDVGTIRLAQSLKKLQGYGDRVAFSRLLDMATELEKAAATIKAAVTESARSAQGET